MSGNTSSSAFYSARFGCRVVIASSRAGHAFLVAGLGYCWRYFSCIVDSIAFRFKWKSLAVHVVAVAGTKTKAAKPESTMCAVLSNLHMLLFCSASSSPEGM